MKISFKILIAALSFTILVTTVSFVYVKSVTEIEPAVSVNGHITRNIFPENFTSIEVRRGNWRVEVVHSDSFFVQIDGGDNLVNNYIKTTVVDSTLILDIDSVMISEKFRYLKAIVEVASLNRLETDKNVSYKLVDVDEKNLELNLKSGSVTLINCRIENLKLNASGNSKFFTSKSSIENFNYSIKDSAFVLVGGANNINCVEIDDLAVFFNYMENDQFVITTSEKRKKLTKQMKSYDNELKWLMPLDTVLQIMEKDSLNFKIDDESLPFLSDYPLEFLPIHSFLNYHNISGKNPDVEMKQLIFSRGLLTDIYIKYYSFSKLTTIYNELKKTYTTQYGTYYEEEIPSYGRESSRNNMHIVNWRITERNLNDKYTKLQLFYDDGNWLFYRFSSPINSFWDNQFNYDTEHLSELRSFPNIVESFTLFFNTPARRPHRNNY